jgi:hypothetical protein
LSTGINPAASEPLHTDERRAILIRSAQESTNPSLPPSRLLRCKQVEIVRTFSRLVRRDERRSESEIQADVRHLILTSPFEIEEADISIVALESPVGDRRRIDVEVGSTVIEVKRDLRRDKARREAEEQLAGYFDFRTIQTGLRYVGVLTDGTEWICYHLREGKLSEVSKIILEDTAADVERLFVWLEGVLATARNIAPTAENIEARLGASSSSYAWVGQP